MQNKTKLAIIFIISIVVISIISLIYSLTLTSSLSIVNDQEEKPSESITIDEIVITETKDAQKYWEVYAKQGMYIKDNSKIILKEIIGNFYKDNNVVMSFEAPSGQYESKLKKITLSDKATVVSEDDVFISADKLIWEGTLDEIHASGNVHVIKSNEIETISDYTIFNKDFTKFELSGNSTTKVLRSDK